MYVTSVLDTWPESGRSRRAFPIDEAIEQVKRPEIKAYLTEVKNRGLHLREPPPESG